MSDRLWKRTLALLAELPSKHLLRLSIGIPLKIQSLDTLKDDLDKLGCIKLLDGILEGTQAYRHLTFLEIYIHLIVEAFNKKSLTPDSEFIRQMVESMLPKFRLRGKVVVKPWIR